MSVDFAIFVRRHGDGFWVFLHGIGASHTRVAARVVSSRLFRVGDTRARVHSAWKWAGVTH